MPTTAERADARTAAPRPWLLPMPALVFIGAVIGGFANAAAQPGVLGSTGEQLSSDSLRVAALGLVVAAIVWSLAGTGRRWAPVGALPALITGVLAVAQGATGLLTLTILLAVAAPAFSAALDPDHVPAWRALAVAGTTITVGVAPALVLFFLGTTLFGTVDANASGKVSSFGLVAAFVFFCFAGAMSAMLVQAKINHVDPE